MGRRTSILALLLTVGGCALPDEGGPTTRPTPQGAERPLTPGYTLTGHPTDGEPGVAAAVHLDVYLLDVPAGSISRDEAFWRTVDENAVGAAADQRLLANGIRCGVAQRDQWHRFADIFSRELTRARKTKVNGLAEQTIELAVDQPADREDVFFLNGDHQWEGRTYDRATNGIALTFGPTPREPGSVRLSLCPIVKREQRLLEFTPMNQPYETPATDVDRIYDVGLSVDVPGDGFFILAPGPAADPVDLTIGGRFLVRRDAAARREQVIVAVPSLMPLNGSSVTVAGH